MKTDLTYVSNELRIKKQPSIIPAALDNELTVQNYENAYIAPYIQFNVSLGGVVTSKMEVVVDNEKEIDSSKYDYSETEIERKTVIYVGFINNCFGHWFTDALRKMWFLMTEQGHRLISQGIEVVYVSPSPLQQVAVEIFKLAGIDTERFRYIDKLTLFDKVIVPENCFCHLRFQKGYPYHKVWGHMIENIKQNVKNCPSPELNQENSLVYLTRTNLANNKKDFGEINVQRIFAAKGYKVIAPEKLCIIEQIRLMQNCKSLVTTEGSISHLALFCRPGTEVVILCKANYRNGYQELINDYAKLNVTYIEAHHSIKADINKPWVGPFYLCINNYLERYFGHPIMHMPYWLMPSYWKYTRNIIYRTAVKVNVHATKVKTIIRSMHLRWRQ